MLFGGIIMIKPYLEAGKAVGTHGLRGEVRVESWFDTPEDLCKIKELYPEPDGGTPFKVEKSRVHGKIVLIKLCGYDTIEAAETLRGKILYVARNDALSLLEDGKSFIQDIIGCSVFDADTNELLGVVDDIITGIANDVWCVKKDGREYLVPAIDEVIIEKSPELEKVTIRPLKGIFDDEN